jgi:cysteine-rich repeat protein
MNVFFRVMLERLFLVFVAAECSQLSTFINRELIALPSRPAPDSVYERYEMPLGLEFMPLCGNGRIDLVSDYVSYFGKSEHARLRVAKKHLVLSSTANDLVEVEWARDEVCDDGNRLDGDGCAADCLSLDVLVSPCLLPVPPVVEDFVFWGEDRVLVSLPDGIYEYSSMMTVGVLVVLKTFRVNAMHYLSTDILYLYTPNDGSEGPGAVYTVSLSTNKLQKLFWVPTMPLQTTHEPSYFVEHSRASKLFLICKVLFLFYYCFFGGWRSHILWHRNRRTFRYGMRFLVKSWIRLNFRPPCRFGALILGTIARAFS